MIRFIPLAQNHIPLFESWLEHEHIKPYWQEDGAGTPKLAQKFLVDLPKRGVHPFVFEVEGRVLGYIQYYNAHKIGGGWWESEPEGTFGIDLLIGEPEALGGGIGPKVIWEFVIFLKSREPGVQSVIIDPEPANLRAIRAFEKAGFKIETEITTPNGRACLMRLKLRGN